MKGKGIVLKSFMGRLFVLWVSTLLVGCASVEEDPEVLVVASDLDNAPFAWMAKSGQPRGRDVEMMEEISRRIGIEIEWKLLPFEELLKATENKSVDLVCATIGATAEREKRVAFSRPYFWTSLRALVREGVEEPRHLEDLEGLKVAAGAGTTSEVALRDQLSESVAVLENKNDLTAEQRLSAGEVDAVIMDAHAASTIARASEGRFRVISERVAVERYALVFARDRYEDLRERINRAIRAMEKSGQMAELDARYRVVQER